MTVTPTDISSAWSAIQPHVRETPSMLVKAGEFPLDYDIWIKLEYLQISGSFKGRGATNFVRTANVGSASVVAASGGNHGAAVAYAARAAGIGADIFIPTISSPAKLAKLKSYGATVHQTGAVFAEAYLAAGAFVESSGGVMVHPYNDPIVVAGAGTVALEFERQVGQLDQVILACGGGGLAAGVAAWYGSRTQVVCCETTGTASYAAAVQAGKPVPVAISGVAADALGATTIGSLAFDILSAVGAESAIVTDDAVMAAKAMLWERFNIVAEPSACVPLAALVAGAWRPEGRVGLVICGANTVLT